MLVICFTYFMCFHIRLLASAPQRNRAINIAAAESVLHP